MSLVEVNDQRTSPCAEPATPMKKNDTGNSQN